MAVVKVRNQVVLGWTGPRAPTASHLCQLYRQQAHTNHYVQNQALQEGECHNQPVSLQKKHPLTEQAKLTRLCAQN